MSEGLKELIALYERALEDGNGCYIWQGTVARNGYGRVCVDGRMMPAHRRALELHLGRRLPKNKDACHHCDVRACIRAEHLFEGTRSENMLDAGRKGRNGMQLHPERNYFGSQTGRQQRARGSRHGSAKLTEEKVRAIRERLAAGDTRKTVAADFGVDTSLIGFIARGVIWKTA